MQAEQTSITLKNMLEFLKISLSMIIAGVSLAVIIKKKEPECPA
ncbi:MAG: hypothetical protein ABR523_00475 [Desulfurivibrionaceae bacterium]